MITVWDMVPELAKELGLLVTNKIGGWKYGTPV
jgi:hypothetical protein